MKQKIGAEKKKNSREIGRVDESIFHKMSTGGHTNGSSMDSDGAEYVVMEDVSQSGGETSEGLDEKPMQIIRVVQDMKGDYPNAQSDKSINSEEAEACTRQGYENLLRDLLTCLARKYRIEEPCGSSQVKHEIWRQLTNEYLTLTGGLVNVTQKEVMRKWTNMKFTSKAKGTPHPLLKAETLDILEVERKLKLCQRFVIGDEAMKRVETTKRIEAIKEQVKAKVQEENADKESRPTLKRLERQILTETLRYEQEKLVHLRELSKMEKDKLAKDCELADISIQKARYELELLKRRRLM